MTWVRLDENIPHHPKFLSISPTAAWLFICGLTYCNRFLTDGVILASALPSLMPTGYHLDRYVIELRSAGLWDKIETRSAGDRDKIETGFQVHDYLDYQPSAETIRAQRAATAARVAAHRMRRNAPVTPLQSDGNAVTPTTCNAPPVRSGPVRSSRTTTPLVASKPTGAESNGFEEWWSDWPRKVAKKEARIAYTSALKRDTAANISTGTRRQLPTYRARPLDKVPHAATFLNGDRWKDEAEGDHDPYALFPHLALCVCGESHDTKAWPKECRR